ncbi:conserved domain-containing protein [Noviherbaspirillum humi]|uniref:Conserved domain-containing protein n=1 Tax=Noviherbaspirillum humi TaxID=1688639 RepID=A0A239LXE3_9BURK|nr:YsnF/AvaK domain-containing protein [Noviherbaspirillum humi]SNT34950.1 conserved domain-containing protein [Noviherbaspirillum humi]
MATHATNDSGMLTGLFYDRDSAERAYQGLSQRGYGKDDVNVIMSDEARKKHFADDGATTELGTKAAEGAGIGGALGGTLGAIIAGVAATGTSLAIPGLGLVIAGPLAAALAGGGAGAATGGLLGALIGHGIPEERVKHYESGLKQGGILMGVKPRSEDDAAYLEQHWRDNKGMHVYRPGSNVMNRDAGHSVIAVYDNYADADKAVQALVAEGLPRDSVHLNPEADAGTASAGTHASDNVDHGRRGFFASLFSGDDEYRDQTDLYAESVRRGSYVLTADTRSEDEAERVTDILNRFNPVDIDERASHWKQQGWTGFDEKAPRYTQDEITRERSSYAATSRTDTAAGTQRIPVIQEELKVGKRMVQRGGVRVLQRVREVPVNEQVTLREEQVKVERHPVDRPASEADLAAFKEGSVELRETAEEAVVSKSARVVEEVEVGKQVSERTERINDTVRRTDVEVEQLGAGTARGAMSDDDAEYRRHWQSTYGTAGGRYEDYGDAYRYGSQMAGTDRYRNYQWEDAEPHLRSDWERSHPGSTWEKVKDAVRYGAERVTGNRRH